MSETLTAKVQRTVAPINRMAAQVIKGGVHYEETVHRGTLLTDDLPSTRPYPACSKPEDNLTGLIFGRFTVIGLSDVCATWVVRCSCGKYTTRRAKSLKAAIAGPNQMCQRCDHNEQKKIGRRSYGLNGESLRFAAIPMYEALREILIHGLTPATRHGAEKAMNKAEEGRQA